jgi:hypothetical protein
MSGLARRFERGVVRRGEVRAYTQRQMDGFSRVVLVNAVVVSSVVGGLVGALVAFLVLRAGWLPVR